MNPTRVFAALLLAGAVAVTGCRQDPQDHRQEVVPPGAVPAPPEGTTPSPAITNGEAHLPAGQQLPGEPALQNGAAREVQTDTPRATDPARVRPGGNE
jgi:hypothetical protein